VGNIDAATLRAVLLAHAEEIACVANTTSKHGVVLAVVHDDGRWLGARMVTAETVRPAEERETTEGYYVPATCRTAEQVRQFIEESLSDVEE
jgi:hypothetical protein